MMLPSSKIEEVTQNSFVFKLADRQIDRFIDIDKDRQKDGQTDRQTDR